MMEIINNILSSCNSDGYKNFITFKIINLELVFVFLE